MDAEWLSCRKWQRQTDSDTDRTIATLTDNERLAQRETESDTETSTDKTDSDRGRYRQNRQ